MPDRTYRVLLWSLAFFGLIADQASKYAVFSWLHEVPNHTYALFQTEPVTRTLAIVPIEPEPFTYVRPRGFFLEVAFEPATDPAERPIPHVNHGALFGFLREHKTAANSLFAVVSLVAALAIVFWSCQKATATDLWLCAALGLILAGTLGNFYDRLMFNGVRDFLHWNYLFDWPVFNIADCCLVTGACLLLVQAFFAPQPVHPPATETTEHNPLTPATAVAGMASGSPRG